MQRILLPALLLAAPAAAQQSDALATLTAADRAWSDSTAARGAVGFAGSFAPDGLYLYPGAPILQGREVVGRTFPVQGGHPLRWQMLRGVVSGDGTHGATFGMLATADSSGPALGRYIAYWVRSDRWRVAAVMHSMPAAEPALPATVSFRPDTVGTGSRGEVERADRAFAADAGVRGAGAAFQAAAAPDAIMFGGAGQLMMGPEEIGASFGGPAAWVWRPVASGAAPGGDLAFTVGTAEITAPVASGGRVYPSKYLTIWRRQPDGSWKFVTDGGNARPAP